MAGHQSTVPGDRNQTLITMTYDSERGSWLPPLRPPIVTRTLQTALGRVRVPTSLATWRRRLLQPSTCLVSGLPYFLPHPIVAVDTQLTTSFVFSSRYFFAPSWYFVLTMSGGRVVMVVGREDGLSTPVAERRRSFHEVSWTLLAWEVLLTLSFL